MYTRTIAPFTLSFPGEPSQPVPVPGCWEAVRADKAFEGPAVYEATFDMHALPPCKRWFLHFARVSYACQVSLNGIALGTHEGMWDAFSIEATHALQAHNTLSVTIYKPGYQKDSRYPLRQVLAGFVPDTGVAFGGIWEIVTLVGDQGVHVSGKPWLEENEGALSLRFTLNGTATGTVILKDASGTCLHTSPLDDATGDCTLPLACAIRPWQPNAPVLYTAVFTFENHTETYPCGLRNTQAQGRSITIGGQPFALRGLLNWGWRKEIAPFATAPEAQQEFSKLFQLGFNAVKCCLYLPSEAYMDVADRLGMVLWVELPLWLPQVTEATLARIQAQYPRFLQALQHHPSVSLVSIGCELGDEVPDALLSQLYHQTRAALPGTLVRDNSGSGECYGTSLVDHADLWDYHFYCDMPHMAPLIASFSAAWRPLRPFVFGETCDADTVRDVRGRDDFYFKDNDIENPLRSLYGQQMLERFPALFGGAQHLPPATMERLSELTPLSYRHALIHRKYQIERVRCFPEVSGYVLTSIRDCPLATSGLFDDAGNLKFVPQDINAFNGERIIALLPPPQAPWRHGGNRLDACDPYNGFVGQRHALYPVLSNQGAALSDLTLRWSLLQGTETTAFGEATVADCAENSVLRLPLMTYSWTKPGACQLVITLENRAGLFCKNTFPLWCHAAEAPAFYVFDPNASLDGWAHALPGSALWTGQTDRPLVTTRWDSAVEAFVQAGGACLVLQTDGGAFPSEPLPFWREACPVLTNHPLVPALHLTPGDTTDLFFYALTADHAFVPATLPFQDIKPILERYDARTYQHHLYAFEAPLGQGRVLATTLRCAGGAGDVPQSLTTNAGGRALLQAAARILAKPHQIEGGMPL